MDRAFQKGDRVRLSEKGRLVHSRTPDRLGTVCAEPLSGINVQVHWDDTPRDSRRPYHYTMLQLMTEKTDARTE